MEQNVVFVAVMLAILNWFEMLCFMKFFWTELRCCVQMAWSWWQNEVLYWWRFKFLWSTSCVLMAWSCCAQNVVKMLSCNAKDCKMIIQKIFWTSLVQVLVRSYRSFCDHLVVFWRWYFNWILLHWTHFIVSKKICASGDSNPRPYACFTMFLPLG